jgi:hypothetical protein
MKAILIDDQNQRFVVPLSGPDDVIRVEDYFVPCAGCSDVILALRVSAAGFCPACDAEVVVDAILAVCDEGEAIDEAEAVP